MRKVITTALMIATVCVFAWVTADICFTFTQGIQKTLGLSDEDIANVASYLDHEIAIFPEILKTKRFRGSLLALQVRAEQFKKRQEAH